MWATISSCLSGSIVTTSAPRSLQKPTTVAAASASVESTGVTKQVRPSNRSALPCSQPVFSEPAMGCAPTKWALPLHGLVP